MADHYPEIADASPNPQLGMSTAANRRFTTVITCPESRLYTQVVLARKGLRPVSLKERFGLKSSIDFDQYFPLPSRK